MLSIELDIFSGMPNPTWILSPQEEKQLLDRIMANPQLMQPPFPKKTIDLGYRGMIVELVKEDDGAWSRARKQSLKNKAANGAPLPSAFRIHGTSVGLGDNTEKWLAETSGEVNSEVESFLKSLPQEAPSPESKKTPESESAPQASTDDEAAKGYYMGCGANYYSGNDFGFWNGSYINRNNCYNYASNYRNSRNYYGATPGVRGGRRFTQFTPSNLISALLRDGWRNGCAGYRNLTIALVVMPRGPTGPDFHFYRKITSSGIWGHKPGHTKAKATDTSSRVITNPSRCDRRYNYNGRLYAGYTDFYGYFYQDNQTAYVY